MGFTSMWFRIRMFGINPLHDSYHHNPLLLPLLPLEWKTVRHRLIPLLKIEMVSREAKSEVTFRVPLRLHRLHHHHTHCNHLPLHYSLLCWGRRLRNLQNKDYYHP